MKLAISGTGRMGIEVRRAAEARGHSVEQAFDRTRPLRSPEQLAEVDAVVDFSNAEAILDVLDCSLRSQTPLVTGTTGWDLGRLAMLPSGHSPVLHAANFSIGAALLRRALSSVLPLLSEADGFGVEIQEIHHTGKLDSPSGTALQLANQLIGGLEWKSRIAVEQTDPDAGDIVPIWSTRTEGVFGIHEVRFAGPSDLVTIRHEAKDRSGFAMGAVLAAEWILPQKGLCSFDDFLDERVAARSSTTI